MIFQTQNQLNCFLIFIFFGIILGIIFNFYNLIFLKNYQKKLTILILNTIFYAFFYIFFVILINFLNFGHFSTTLFFSYILGFITSKRLSFNLVVIFEKKWYTIIKLLFKKQQNKRKPNSNEQSKKS